MLANSLVQIVLLGTFSVATMIVPAEVRADDKKYVIIHADDAGMSHSVNRATIEAMDKGFVTSASIMVPCPWFEAFAKYAKDHPEKDYGIHLTLTSEFSDYKWGPVSPLDKVPSLVDRDGFLWQNSKEVAANVVTSEVETELRAQIDLAKKRGVPLTHLDTHMGSLFGRPDLTELFVNLGIEYDLPVLFVNPQGNELLLAAYPGLKEKAPQIVTALEKARFPILRSVFQFYKDGEYDQRKKTYLDVLRNLKPGVTEFIIHCGYDDPELAAITGSATLRDSDRRIFSDPEVLEEIKRLNIELFTWKQFKELAAKGEVAGREKAVGQTAAAR